MDGIKGHRERFAQRYPWVKKLMETENITLDVDESVFRGSAQEVLSKHCDKVDSPSGNYFQTGRDRRLFTKRWLESLLAVDFIFACGSAQDRKDAMALLEQTMTQAEDSGDTPERAQRGAELEIPAVFEIAMPIANEFPDDVPENLIRFMPHLITGKENAAAYLDCLKWCLRVKAFSKWAALMDLNQLEVSNRLVDHGLLHEAIYWHHLQEKVRPDPGAGDLAVKALFKRIYGDKAWAAEHKKYLALLDAAYPPANQGLKPSPSKS